MDRQNIVVLGATGSIGKQAIEVALSHPKEFKIIAIAAEKNIEEIIVQAAVVKPDFICLVDETAAKELREVYKGQGEILAGPDGLKRLCSLENADIVLNAIVGSDGLMATLKVIKAKKRLALANKESLVAAGELVKKNIKKYKSTMIPVDSEHNALWQCLNGERVSEVSRLILTASGGPFWGRQESELADITPAEALDHPRWQMGNRISIDSATLMNKGFEIIEAHHIFDLPYDKIQIVIHPQSIIHSLVEFVDGSIMAHLGPTDMRLPILYSFSWPKRMISHLEKLDLTKTSPLEFFAPDIKKAPCLKLAYEAAGKGLSYPTVLNAADEVAVAGFLSGKISFNQIGNIIDTVLERHSPIPIGSLEDFEVADSWAKSEAKKVVTGMLR